MSLAGRCVLVTRPREQAAVLSGLITAAGGVPVEFPALAISPVEPAPALPFNPDIVLFVSRNAARFGAPLLASGLPAQCYAVGPGTARALAAAGRADAITPDGQDSEALLALPGLQAVAGQKILIVRGVGGRERLAATLRERGAEVAYLECYRRSCPHADATPLTERWQAGGIDAVTVASFETLANLATLLGENQRRLLCDTPVFAPHEKIAAAARRFGVRQAVATGGGDAGLVAGLVNWFRNPQ